MSFFDLRILITPLVSSNSSQNNHIIYTKKTIVERMVGEGGGVVFIRYNKQWSEFPLKRIMKLVFGYRLTIFRPLSTQSLCFITPPPSFSMSLYKYPPLLHFQQYCSYTVIQWRSVAYWQRKPEHPEVP